MVCPPIHCRPVHEAVHCSLGSRLGHCSVVPHSCWHALGTFAVLQQPGQRIAVCDLLRSAHDCLSRLEVLAHTVGDHFVADLLRVAHLEAREHAARNEALGHLLLDVPIHRSSPESDFHTHSSVTHNDRQNTGDTDPFVHKNVEAEEQEEVHKSSAKGSCHCASS